MIATKYSHAHIVSIFIISLVASGANASDLLVIPQAAPTSATAPDRTLFRFAVRQLSASLRDRGDTATLVPPGPADDAAILAAARATDSAPAGVLPLAISVVLTDGAVTVRLSGRLLTVADGSEIARFDVPVAGPWRAPPSCDDDCAVRIVREDPWPVGRALVEAVLPHLPGAPPPPLLPATSPAPTAEPVRAAPAPAPASAGLVRGVDLSLVNLAPAEVAAIEDRLAALPGYRSHRPTGQEMRSVGFWYETATDPADFRRALALVLEEMKIPARVTVDGGRIAVERLLDPQARGGGWQGAEAIAGALESDKAGTDLEVEFAFDSAALTPSARAQLDELGFALHSGGLRDARIAIRGHTDAKGADAYNLDLSRRRADVVARYLIDRFQVPAVRLTAEGFGESRLKNPADPFGAENRRVEVARLPKK